MPTPKTPAAPRNTEEHLVRQAIGHLRGILEVLGPCEHFDHHGYCQSHFIESPCRVGKAREFLGSLPNAPRLPDERSEDRQHAVVLPPDGLKCLENLAWTIGRDDAAKGLNPARAEKYRPDKAAMYMAGYAAQQRQNARPHAEERIDDSVQADVGPTFRTGKYRGYVCDACGEEFPHETSRDVHFRRAQRGLGCRANEKVEAPK